MAGLQRSFGLDGAIGCYEDIEHADVFVLWDNNLAETDPVLFSRMLDRRAPTPPSASSRWPRARPAPATPPTAPCSTRPTRRLAIANASATSWSPENGAPQEFVEKHVAFKRGKTAIGYGLSDEELVAEDAKERSGDEYVAFLAAYTPERAQEMSGLSAASIRWLASLYGDPLRR